MVKEGIGLTGEVTAEASCLAINLMGRDKPQGAKINFASSKEVSWVRRKSE